MWNKIADVGMPGTGDYSVLVYHVNGSVEMCHADDLRWAAGLSLYTHWMPLPAPPTADNSGAEPVQTHNTPTTQCLCEHNVNGICYLNGLCRPIKGKKCRVEVTA